MSDMRNLIWIAAYPKSGSTWMRLFVAHLLAEKADAASIRDQILRVPVDFGLMGFDTALGIKLADFTPEEAVVLKPRRLEAEARLLSRPSLFRTHDAWVRTSAGEPLLSAAATARAIHLVRDPRDIAVSFAEFFDCDQDQAISRMADPEYRLVFDPDGPAGPQVPITLLDWSGHCRSWLAAEEVPRLLVRYEDLLADPLGEFTRMAVFAGLPASAERIGRAVEETRFDRLKARDQNEGFAFRGDGRSHFRVGRAGGWRDGLTAEQARRIERDHGEVMTRLGYALG
ncbi:sulfotransferase domain-containing protein [Rhodospirillum rubrum]|nr:sulfotransferase domain-containing protein [Rhodospirillum rubrum]